MLWSTRRPHYGDPVACLRDLLVGMPAALAPEAAAASRRRARGGCARQAGAALPVLEDAGHCLRKDHGSGGPLGHRDRRSERLFVCRLAAAVPEFAMNESCVSTGSFFEDQMTRLGPGSRTSPHSWGAPRT
ncbi:MAG: hypothetical protein ACLU0O_09460 [Collinsella sp.]